MKMKQGFTLVEIMIVVLIIGLLAAIAVPNFAKARQKTQTNACIDNMRSIEGAVEQLKMEGEAVSAENLFGAEKLIKVEPKCPALKTSTSYVLPKTDADRPTCPNVGTYADHVLP